MFGYDGLNRVVRDTMGMIESDLCTFDPDNGYDCPPPTTDSVRSFIYDAVGNMTRDSLKRIFYGTTEVATGAYGTGNRITSFDGCNYQTDADGNVTQRSGCGSTVNSTDPTAVDSLLYNSDGLVTYARPAGGTATITTYGAWAQPETINGIGQPSRTFILGTNVRIDSTWVGGTNVTRFTYDSRGRVPGTLQARPGAGPPRLATMPTAG